MRLFGPDNPGGSAISRLRVLLIGLLLCRGVVLLCIMPPLEPWDEYQHVAYLVHLAQRGEPPVLGKASVAPELLLALSALPQSHNATTQLVGQGVVDYWQYWAELDGRGTAPPRDYRAVHPLPLYEAQHSPLYYRLMLPAFQASGGVNDLRLSVACLRTVNLIFTALAAWVALGIVGKIVPSRAPAALIGLLVATQPLYLMNGVRVANDALGVLTATAAISWGLSLRREGLLRRSLVLGLFVGVAFLAKAVNLALVPYAAGVWLMVVIRDRVGLPKALGAAALMAGGCLALAQAEIRSNLANYGTPTATQEVVKNHRDGRTSADRIHTANHLNWGGRMVRLWFKDNMAVAGWSFQKAHRRLTRLYGRVLLFCLLGWASGMIIRRRRHSPAPLDSWTSLAACALICLSYSGVLAAHIIESKLAWGHPTTNPWYAAAAFPAFLVLVGAGAWSWPLGRLRLIVPILLSYLFVKAEAIVEWGLIPAIGTGGAGGAEALSRLATLQPRALGTVTLLAATLAACALYGLALFQCLRICLADVPAPTLADARAPHFISALRRTEPEPAESAG